MKNPTGKKQPVGYLQSMVEATKSKSKPEVRVGFERGTTTTACKPNALTTGPPLPPKSWHNFNVPTDPWSRLVGFFKKTK